jgi:hypothetical protein
LFHRAHSAVPWNFFNDVMLGIRLGRSQQDQVLAEDRAEAKWAATKRRYMPEVWRP